MKDITQCRAEIDAIDKELAGLFEKRMLVAGGGGGGQQ